MIAYILSPAGRLDRRGYVVPIAAFFGLALVSALASGSRLSWSSVGGILDNPWGMIGRGLDASVLSALPIPVQVALAIALFGGALWALFALTIKRLHDLGQSGWWSALLLVPGISALVMLFCAFAPGRQPATA